MTEDDIALWRAVQKLRSTTVWLMTGAHPDDEWSGFLAWLGFGQGVHCVYACATRGEGGQNALGPERGRRLGALRSIEMERAAAELDLTLRWIGAGPTNGADDPIHDFGFSKSGDDTMRRWGEERLLARLVAVIRAEQPDMVSPTFLDVPGQHGHHQAITRMTLRAAECAADPAFAPELGAAWRVARVCLPAFSGAGAAYDDTEPPPPATWRIDLGERCGPLGGSWAQVGERSRAHHASQGMGRTVPDGPRPLALHLAAGRPGEDPLDGLPRGLADLDAALAPADAAIAEAVAAFPDRARIAAAAHLALGRLADAGDDRRIALKCRQLARVAALALGIGGRLAVAPLPLRAATPAVIELATTGAATVTLHAPPRWQITGGTLLPPADAPRFTTLRDGFDPLGGNDPLGATLAWTHHGTAATMLLDPAERLSLPAIDPPPARLAEGAVAIDPDARVGVIAGEADETLAALREIGIAAEDVDDATLAQGDLTGFTTLLIGIFGFGQRPALLAHRDRLMAWIAAGGHLVTLYHRPGDGWHDGRTPPRRITIGSPSLRWRVTDPTVPVTILQPDHRLLTWPNRIAPADWDGWVRERGLYFAAGWDPAYTPLLAMSDPGEPPLTGALLTASIGRGRHTHVALALHHQLSARITGGFRLLANLTAATEAV